MGQRVVEQHGHKPSYDLSVEDAGEGKERQHKREVVYDRRGQRQEAKSKQDKVDPQGIEQRVEVGRRVALFIDGADRHLLKRASPGAYTPVTCPAQTHNPWKAAAAVWTASCAEYRGARFGYRKVFAP